MNIKSVSLKKNNSFLLILKGAFNALILSLIGILIFAFIIKFTSISDGLIKPINQIIKVISIFFGCMFSIRASQGNKIFKGLLIGVVYTVLAFVLFSSLNGTFDVNISILLDILFGGVIGFISAIIINIFAKK